MKTDAPATLKRKPGRSAGRLPSGQINKNGRVIGTRPVRISRRDIGVREFKCQSAPAESDGGEDVSYGRGYRSSLSVGKERQVGTSFVPPPNTALETPRPPK